MRRRAAVFLLLPFLALGAACGGDDDDDSSASGGGGGGGGDFCDRATLIDERFNELDETFAGTDLPTSEVFDEAANAIGDLADGAPDEIKEDLEIVADGIREIAEVFGEIDLSDPEAMSDPANLEALTAMGERMEELDVRVSASSDRVEAYLRDECGIETDDGTSGEGTEDGS